MYGILLANARGSGTLILNRDREGAVVEASPGHHTTWFNIEGAVNQTYGEAEFINREPSATAVRTDRRDVSHTAALFDSRRQSCSACPLLVPITEEVIPVRLMNPTDGAHYAASAVFDAWWRSVDGAMPKCGSICTPCALRVIAIKAKW